MKTNKFFNKLVVVFALVGLMASPVVAEDNEVLLDPTR